MSSFWISVILGKISHFRFFVRYTMLNLLCLQKSQRENGLQNSLQYRLPVNPSDDEMAMGYSQRECL